MRIKATPALSKAAAEIFGKPEQYVMACLGESAVLMAGKPGLAAFVDVRGIGGFGGPVNARLSQKICALLKEALHIPPERIYLNFTDMEAGNWGHDGGTFG